MRGMNGAGTACNVSVKGKGEAQERQERGDARDDHLTLGARPEEVLVSRSRGPLDAYGNGLTARLIE